jgi:hypothetical protein
VDVNLNRKTQGVEENKRGIAAFSIKSGNVR